jgi:hypothetical protein
MQLPLQITVRDLSLSEAAETDIRTKAADLDTYYDGIMSCRVVVEGPVRHHHTGPFTVRIDLTVPGAELAELGLIRRDLATPRMPRRSPPPAVASNRSRIWRTTSEASSQEATPSPFRLPGGKPRLRGH